MFTVSNPIYHQNEYIMDDKRKVVVNIRDANQFQFNLYKRSMYKTLRPDLNSADWLVFKEKYRIGELYLNELRRRLNLEVTRDGMLGHSAKNKHNLKVIRIVLYPS